MSSEAKWKTKMDPRWPPEAKMEPNMTPRWPQRGPNGVPSGLKNGTTLIDPASRGLNFGGLGLPKGAKLLIILDLRSKKA